MRYETLKINNKTNMLYKTREQTEALQKIRPEMICEISSTGFHMFEVFQFRKENQLLAICTRCLMQKNVHVDKKHTSD